MKIFSGSTSTTLVSQIANTGNFSLGKVNHKCFPDGEICPQLVDIQPEETVVIIQATPPPAENWIELYLMLHAAKKAGAGKIIALIPYLGYNRQNRIYQEGTPHSSKLMADLIQTAGAHICITCEAHDKNINQHFNIPLYNLSTKSLFTSHLQKYHFPNPLFVAPDSGAFYLAEQYATHFRAPMIKLEKKRDTSGEITQLHLHHSLTKNKNIVLVDDLLATGDTLIKATKLLFQNGSHSIHIICTHALPSKKTYNKLHNTPGIEEIIITDTLKHTSEHPFTILNIAPLFSAALQKII